MYNSHEYVNFRHLYYLPEASGIPVPDQRIEVLMSDLDESVMALFKRTFSADPHVIANVHGTTWLFNFLSALPAHTHTHTHKQYCTVKYILVFLLYYRCFNISIMQASGIDLIFPGATLDHAVFDPCGYSANGLIFQVIFVL